MFEAILNVLAILALTVAAGFIILLLVDLILGCIDGKRGVIFFRNRKNTSRDNEILLEYNKDANLNDSYYIQNNSNDLTLDFDKQYEKENQPEQTNNVDLEKAEQERKIIEERNKQDIEETPSIEEEKPSEPETEVNDEFTFINKISPELEKELAEENEEEDEFPEFADDDDDEDDDEQSIEEILQAIRERNMRARNKFLAEEEMDPDFDEEEDEEETSEEKVEEMKEEKTEVEDAVEEAKEVENQEVVQTEIDKLNEIIKQLNAKIEEEQNKNAELENKAKTDIENLKKEYEEKLVEADDVPAESVETLEAKLNELQERQKQNDKDLKINKKEYLPLARIERTLESDENKLRRREAIVAKRKIVLFGVNNYVQDEEKERKLQEDLDLLEGLRMSVNHCREVMDANKDRYPVLKRTNEILTRNAEQIENDIKEVKEKLEKAKEAENESNVVTDNNSDDSSNADNN